MEDPAVDIHIGIFDNLRGKEVVLRELDVRTFVFGFHVVSYIDVLDDEFQRWICVRYDGACESICSSHLGLLDFFCEILY
jgi:hypothetical protein